MQSLRSIHLYLGCMFAPLRLFFAISGIWQTLGIRSHLLDRLFTIHGYGSSDRVERSASVCKSFGLRKKEGVIKDFIAGGTFTTFNRTLLALLDVVMELRDDPDSSATNEGVLILWLT